MGEKFRRSEAKQLEIKSQKFEIGQTLVKYDNAKQFVTDGKKQVWKNCEFTIKFGEIEYKTDSKTKKIFISSIDGPKTVHVGNSNYAATKGALSAFMKGVAVELAQQNIRANAILPGMTETPLIYSPKISSEQLDLDRKNYPLRRYGDPKEIAFGAIYFLSDAASWTTGAELVIDGGFTLL